MMDTFDLWVFVQHIENFETYLKKDLNLGDDNHLVIKTKDFKESIIKMIDG